MYFRKITLVAGLAAMVATPALAQKSKDTLRVAINNPVSVLSPYDLPVDEAAMFYRDIYEYLLYFNEHEKKFVPALAKSWKRIDNTTVEFELRDDIKFHNGNTFDADDVVATINYIIDPKSKITFAANYTWVKEVEKLGSHKIRIHAKVPTGTDLANLAYRFGMWDAETMAKLNDTADYGRLSPVGTGTLKVVDLDKNKGVLVEKWADYKTLPKNQKTMAVKRVHGIPMPDRQTQAAQMITGGVDLLRNVAPDQAKAMAENPGIEITYIKSPSLVYLALDSQNLSGNKALSDPRVRKAIHMAIDRELIIKNIIPGGEVAEHIQADCFQATTACAYSVKPPAYDPEGAKKLLAEAGYPNGFDLNYLVYTPNKPVAEAIAGELYKIGIRVAVQPADISLYRRLQGEGKLQAWSILFPTGSFPDAGNIFRVLFSGPAMKYYDDDVIRDAMEKGEAEFDSEKRTAIYKKAFDRVNEMHYHLPISSVPTVYVHSAGVKIDTNAFSAGETYIVDYLWK